MKVKKKKNIGLYVILFLFLCFIILYVSKETGYYEYKAHTKRVLTEEAIAKFEKDLAQGKDVSAEDYAVITYVDYSNSVSDIGYKAGSAIERFMTKGIKNTFKIFSALFLN